ncbi:inovirus Gp2 family protein, partial [Salmonella enterica subsp. enterica serovar Enteritidis]|nr:inovirus Gp2 family protein [Salmonella enterica subsp. enterica serovar Enteritidis]
MKSPYDLAEREFKFLLQEAEDKYDSRISRHM